MKKTKRNPILAAALAALAALYGQGAGAAEPGVFSLTAGFDYSSGKYGADATTDILYLPIIGRYETGPWVFKLTVPYIQIDGPGNVVRDIGVVRRGAAPRTTESGLGDIVAAASYNVYGEKGPDPLIVDLTGKIKFGTADETKGLGTGENDYALQVDLYKSIGRFTPFGTLGYRVLGEPAGIELNNVWYASLGGSYKFTRQTSGGLIFDYREKASLAGAPQRELTAFVVHRFDKAWKAQGYAVGGFADGSPDWGVGANLGYSF